jgi:protein FRA10AC1
MGQKQKATHFALPIKRERKDQPNVYLDPYLRHKQIVQYYQGLKPSSSIPNKTEVQILKQNHQYTCLIRFLRSDEEECSWESRLARKYYDKLFKEYCLGDFNRYKTGQVGLRWRTKKECISGKGHFNCGNLKCDETEGLRSWEVHFRYTETETIKEALVKIRLCPICSEKLNYKNRVDKRKYVDEAVSKDGKEKKFRILDQNEELRDPEIPGNTEVDNRKDDEQIWSKPFDFDALQSKSKEEEIDQFLAEMFQ